MSLVRNRIFRALVSVSGILFISMAALADWDPGMDHKMHHPQLPDLSTEGIDVNATMPNVIADDFMCMQDGKITDIHIWGSWFNDIEDETAMFILSIHEDIPTNETQEYSMPGTTVWFRVIGPGEYTKRVYFDTAPAGEGWMNPPGIYIPPVPPPPPDTKVYQYNFYIDKTSAFTQSSGTIYWLDVQYIQMGPQQFGWKTCVPADRWNDDATWAMGEEPYVTGWTNLVYLPPHPLEGQTLDMSFVITGEPEELDYGDAPDPTYPTLSASQGACHVLDLVTYMGATVDFEADGQPHANAIGDDSNGVPNDEDGVTFTAPLRVGSAASVEVVASVGGGLLNAWVDFNADGDWADAGEQIFTDKSLTASTNKLGFSVPAAATVGNTFARFRFSTVAGLTYTGKAANGEVEDYEVAILEEEAQLDFGDADDNPFPTLLANNGARHVIVPGVYLGKTIDSESDGQPDGTATGDDLTTTDDEDGVTFPAPLLQGQPGAVDVVASTSGFLWAWMDFAGNGDWNDPQEQIFAAHPLAAGTNHLMFPVPVYGAVSADARFRYTTNNIPGLSYTGRVDNGEVEDYEVQVHDADYGDAPDSYGTLFASDGARHIIAGGVRLGGTVDAETDGQPGANALNDDITGTIDDEDGVTIPVQLVRGSNVSVQVTASAAGYLNAWIDWNINGNWNEANEHVFNGTAVTPGVNSLVVPVPYTLTLGDTYARFRYNTIQSNLTSRGIAMDGEVEDYRVILMQAQPSSSVVLTNVAVQVSNSVATVVWQAESNVLYQLQGCTNLMENPINWTNIQGLVIGPANRVSDSNAVANPKFYRILVPDTVP